MNEAWLVPAVVVGVFSLLLQGLKAGWDLYFSVVTQSRAANSLKLQEIGALVQLVEALPLDAARKAVWKTEIVRTLRRGIPMSTVLEAVEKAVQEV